MSHLIKISLLCLTLMFSGFQLTFAQESKDCKVLLPELAGEYTGGCKKGLANGTGVAKGTDSYKGSFKKGLPDGKGVYTYASGAVYEGMFKFGKRDGMGKLTYLNEGGQVVEEGIWKENSYIGKAPEAPYEIIRKQNILRYSIFKTSDPREMIMVKITRNGTTIYPSNLMLYSSNGSVTQQGSFNGFEQITFPVTCNIKYSLLTAFNNSYVDYELEFIIKEPGSWEVTLSH